jgi:hypothetical protein
VLFGETTEGPSGKLLLLVGGVLKGVQFPGVLIGILNLIPVFLGMGGLFGWMKLLVAGMLEYMFNYLDFYRLFRLFTPFGIKLYLKGLKGC